MTRETKWTETASPVLVAVLEIVQLSREQTCLLRAVPLDRWTATDVAEYHRKEYRISKLCDEIDRIVFPS
jgi:hypothetical protein